MFKKYFFISIFSASFLVISITSSSNKISSICLPTDTKVISSYYGYREIFGNTSFHNGIDFPISPGSNVYAFCSGTVTHAGFLTGYGNTIIISHDNGFKSLYAHLESIFLVKLGQYVTTKQQIGKVGPKYLENGMLNGYTTGPHLHFSIFDTNGNSFDPVTILGL